MSLIVHQIKKDVVHQRWLLVAWAVLLLVHLLVSGFQLLRHVPNPGESTERFADMLGIWVVFLPLLLGILAVQSDPVAGTSGFWLTRPLRGGRLLAAKGLYLLAFFFALPLAVEVGILLLRGAGSMAWLALPEATVVRLPVVMGALAIGAATPRFLHALALAGSGGALASLTVLLGQYLIWGGPEGAPQAGAGSRGIVALWVLAVAFTGAAALLFVTRREGLGRGVFAVGIGAAMIGLVAWPWNLLDRPSGTPGGVGLHLYPQNLSIETLQGTSRTGIPVRHLSIPVEIGERAGIAPNHFFAPVSSRVELRTAAVGKLTGFASYAVIPSQQNYRAALRSIFSPLGFRLSSPGDLVSEEDYLHPLSHTFPIGDEDFARLVGEVEEIRVAIDLG